LSSNIKVSIVVPCYNEREFIIPCADSVLKSLDAAAVLGEVIVVDGMSSDGTRELLSRHAELGKRLRLLDNPKQSTPFALNIGIKAAFGEVIIILGGHSTVKADFIAQNLKALDNNPVAACVGGTIINAYHDEESAAIGAAMSSSFGVGNARFRTGGLAGFVDTVAFGAYRREVFDEVGYFDEELTRNQDDELNFRLVSAGKRIWFEPKIQSTYHVRASFKKLAKQYFQYGYWKVYVNKKHQTITSARQLVPLFFFIFICLAALLTLLDVAGVHVQAELIRLGFAIMLLYMILMIWSAFKIRKTENDTTPIALIARAFFTLHFHYGRGYFLGIIDFLLRDKKPSHKASAHSR